LLYEDEFSLSNTATVGYQWSAKGQQPQVPCKQKKRERQTTFGSFNYDTGQITVSFANKGNSTTFKKHLKKVLHAYRSAPKIIMVLDNVAYHHANRIKN
jgi:hypothetical protein